MTPKLNRGLVSMVLAVLMLVVGSMARRVFPLETEYVYWLFLFGAALFLADASVTMTRMGPEDVEAEARRDAAANPWRIAFAVAFLLTLVAASRTGSSFVTATAMLLAVVAAGVYLVRRQFFANLRDMFRVQRHANDRLRSALKARDHLELMALLEERIEREPDGSRRNALLLSLGAVHVVRGDYDEAVRAFERIDRHARSKDGDDWIDMSYVVDLNVASAYVAKGDYELAETTLSRIDAKALPSEFKVAYDINRSSLLIGRGKHDEAIRFLDDLGIEKLEPKSRFPFLRDLAEALAASDPERALKVATECLEIESGPQAHNVMAVVRIARREMEEAATRLEEALRLNPEGRVNLRVFAESLYYLGVTRRASGNEAAARELFERASAVKGGGRFSRAAVEALRP